MLEKGGGPRCAPRVSAKSCMVIIGTRGIGMAKGGLRRGVCCGRSSCIKKVERAALTRLLTGGPRGIVRLTIGKVLPGKPVKESVVGGLRMCTKPRRTGRTRGPRILAF